MAGFVCHWNGCYRQFPTSYSLRRHKARASHEHTPVSVSREGGANGTCQRGVLSMGRVDEEDVVEGEDMHRYERHRMLDSMEAMTEEVVLPESIQMDEEEMPAVDVVHAVDIEQEEHNEEDATTPPSDACGDVVHALADVQDHVSKALFRALFMSLMSADLDMGELRRTIKQKDCRVVSDKLRRGGIVESGFQRKEVLLDTGELKATYYTRDIVEVVRKQVELVEELVCDRKGGGCTCRLEHVQRFECSAEAIRVKQHVRNSIMESEDGSMLWNDDAENGTVDDVLYLQMYSDKSALTLKGGSTKLYPLHISVLNMCPRKRTRCIQSGGTIVALLPVQFEQCVPLGADNSARMGPVRHVREDIMRLTQMCISAILCPLEEQALHGMTIDSVHTRRRWFPVLVSVCADLPESKDLSALRGGTSTNKPCTRCNITKVQLGSGNVAEARSDAQVFNVRERVRDLLEKANSCRAQGEKAMFFSLRDESRAILQMESLQPWESVLPYKLMLERNVRSTYQIFTFEPLHNMSLGISKLLKSNIYAILGEPDLLTRFLRSSWPIPRASVLRGANMFLRNIHKQWTAPGISFHYCGSGTGSRLDGIFTETGLRGMLEGKEYDLLDEVFPFIAAYMDRVCGIRSGRLTELCVMYTELLHWVFRRGLDKHWGTEEVRDLGMYIRRFISRMVRAFPSVRGVGCMTTKFHMLTHLAEDIARFGSVVWLDASSYENAHGVLKRIYRRTSGRKNGGMREMVSRAPRELLRLSERMYAEERPAKKAKVETYICGQKHLEKTTFSDVRRACLAFVSGEGSSEGRVDLDIVAQKVVRLLGRDACHVFANVVSQELGIEAVHNTSQLGIGRTAYVKGGVVPILEDFNGRTSEVHVGHVAQESTQRVYATEGFAGDDRTRQSFVAYRGSGNPGAEIGPVGFARVLLLFQCENGQEAKQPYAFIQYLDPVPARDDRDKVLGCVVLRWSNHADCDEDGVGPWFGLTKLEDVCGTLHVVEDVGVGTDMSQTVEWYDRRFYVNRFYRRGQ